MNRAKFALAILTTTLSLAGCSQIPATVTVAQEQASSSDHPTASLATTAQSLGCSEYTQSAEVAPFAAEWGTCRFDGTTVRAYAFTTDADWMSFLESVAAFGIVESQFVRVGTFAFAPDDQTVTQALRAAAG